ncbi:MAG: PEP-CTERM sorting domain-containing protein [Phycisphaeraceae bacterium]|nr:PEP-CTERM sorting domain-containing protein [Phycisphaeraceae bacterium]
MFNQFSKHTEAAMAAMILATAGMATSPARAAVIGTADIVAIPQGVTGSGNGTLDLRMFTYSGSEIQNTSGAFNGDNGNNTLPHAGGADTASFAESYVTTAGDLKAYYNLNFAPGSINQIMLMLDLNETGGGEPNNTLAKLDVILNPTSIQSNPSPLGDVSSATQAAINQVYSGGSVIANLSPQPAANIPVNSQGAGFADYAIFTGINPFNLNDSDVLLFNVSMSVLSNGSEEIFLSGSYAPLDIAPEPASLALLATGGSLLLRRRC